MRVVNFADGFTSATAPDIIGGSSYEKYTISNNSSGNVTGLIFSSASYTSVIGSIEVERKGSSTYRQTIDVKFQFNGTWAVTFGNFMGDELIQDSLTLPQEINLSINSSTGQVTYSSGNLSGHTSSSLKFNIIRTKA